MTGVSPPPPLIRGTVNQMGHPPNQIYRLYDNTTTQLDAIANGYQTDYQVGKWRYPPSWTVVMFSRNKFYCIASL